jgi:hypothetical protein
MSRTNPTNTGLLGAEIVADMLKDEGITVSGRTIRRWCRAGRVPGSRRVNLVGKWAMPQSSLWHIKQLVSGDAK